MAEEGKEEGAAVAASDKKKSKVDEAKETVARMEAATKLMNEALDRAESLRAENVISGESEAGKPAEKPKDESPEEYAEKVMRNEVETS